RRSGTPRARNLAEAKHSCTRCPRRSPRSRRKFRRGLRCARVPGSRRRAAAFTKRNTRAIRRINVMTSLKLAGRAVLKSPFVTAVAVISLGLGIGANAAIFSLFNQILLRPLPVAEPSRLVNFEAPGPRQGSNSCNNQGSCDETLSYPMFRDLEAQQTVF